MYASGQEQALVQMLRDSEKLASDVTSEQDERESCQVGKRGQGQEEREKSASIRCTGGSSSAGPIQVFFF